MLSMRAGTPHFRPNVISRTTSIGIDQAYRTLCNAALFLGAAPTSPGADPARVRYPAKVLGNGLRELDRFLSVLLDEVAAGTGWSMEDLAPLARIRNTPNKLAAVSLRMDLQDQHDARLRALGRCRDTLFHCGGVVRRGDRRHARTLTLGWPGDMPDGGARVLQIGEHLSLGPADLAWICAFYVRIGDSLLERAAR